MKRVPSRVPAPEASRRSLSWSLRTACLEEAFWARPRERSYGRFEHKEHKTGMNIGTLQLMLHILPSSRFNVSLERRLHQTWFLPHPRLCTFLQRCVNERQNVVYMLYYNANWARDFENSDNGGLVEDPV
jgi:hypothetical protein